MYFLVSELFLWASVALIRFFIPTFRLYHRPQKLWDVIAVNVTTCTRLVSRFMLSRFSCLNHMIDHTWSFCCGDNTGPGNSPASHLHFLSTTTIHGKSDKTVTFYHCRYRCIGPIRPSWRFPSTDVSSKLHFLPTTTIERKLNKPVPSCCRHLSIVRMC